MKKLFIYLFIYLFIIRCQPSGNKNDYFKHSKQLISEHEYNVLFQSIKDSLSVFQLNKLRNYDFLNSGDWWNDSLICLNNKKDRVITCILSSSSNFKDAVADGIQFLYGEKINSQWYFFKGASIVIPRSMVKDQQINKPFSYQQLHQIALKEVYGGYFKKNGEINEGWFTSHFEGSAYGDFYNQESSLKFLNTKEKFTDRRKFFEAIHLQSVKNNWYGVNKDSIKQLPSKNNLP